MNDVFLALVIPILIVLLAAIYKILDTVWLNQPDCDHHYGDWHEFHETHYAYVQKRTCQKCKYTQTLEHKKASHEHTATTQTSNKRFW